jgi:hypothetical protein
MDRFTTTSVVGTNGTAEAGTGISVAIEQAGFGVEERPRWNLRTATA